MPTLSDAELADIRAAFPAGWQAAADALAGACDTAIATLLPSVVPVFRMASARRTEFEGSGILLARGDARYLFTAAHVIDACQGRPVLLDSGVGVPSGEPHLTNPPAGRTREADTLDLGAVRLTNPEVQALGPARFAGLSADNTEPRRPDLTLFVLIGFPAVHQAFDTAHGRYDVQARVTRLGYAETRAYDSTGLSPSTHRLLGYRDKRIEEGGRRGAPAHLRGTSGGGVWRLEMTPEGRLATNPEFEGIFTERPHRFRPSLMVTRPLVLNMFLDVNAL